MGQQIARLSRDGVRPSSEHPSQLTFRSKYFPSSPYLAEVTVLLVLPPQALLPVTGALTVTLAPTKLVLVMVTPFVAPCIMNPLSLSLSLELSNHFALLQLSPRLISCALGPIGSRDLGPRKTNLALSPNAKDLFPNISIRKTRFRFFQSSPTGGDRHEVIERARAQRESERERGRGGPGHGGR